MLQPCALQLLRWRVIDCTDCRAASRPLAELSAKPLTLCSCEAIHATTTTTLTLIFISLTGAQCKAEKTALASDAKSVAAAAVAVLLQVAD
jgi:hypothetical protein